MVLLRDIAVLQVKLIVDGLRDVVLVPASLVAGLISLVSTEDGKPGQHFYRVLGVGKQSERWIDLFGALRNAPPDLEDTPTFPDASMDDLVGRLETYVVEEHRRGGITSQAKERLDRALDAISKDARKAGKKS
jgi:hypothetical protein